MKTQIEKFMRYETCPECHGARLKKEALSVTLGAKSIVDVSDMAIGDALAFVAHLPSVMSSREQEIAKLILREITQRLTFLENVGLDYLTLNRTASTLAGGKHSESVWRHKLGVD